MTLPSLPPLRSLDIAVHLGHAKQQAPPTFGQGVRAPQDSPSSIGLSAPAGVVPKKGVKACLNCKTMHVSCSHARPCNRCVKRGKACVDVPSRRAIKGPAREYQESAPQMDEPLPRPQDPYGFRRELKGQYSQTWAPPRPLPIYPSSRSTFQTMDDYALFPRASQSPPERPYSSCSSSSSLSSSTTTTANTFHKSPPAMPFLPYLKTTVPLPYSRDRPLFKESSERDF